MAKFLMEEDDITMDVQAGPNDDEIEVTADAEEGIPTPVDAAKADPGNIVVAAVKVDDDPEAGNDEPKLEFYVDARDVEKYASLVECTMIDALNDIIAANESRFDINADNIVVVIGESTYQYAKSLDQHGASYVYISEDADCGDINIDVQVGPNDDEIEVSADPQEANANPVDIAKKAYETVCVAQKDDDFFVDVEDVQKCADVNCESVVDTLNGIILANEGSGMDASNLVILVKEGVEYDAIAEMNEARSNFNCMVY